MGAVRLADLNAKLTQVSPLATGIYTGLYFRCNKDPRGKRGHSILFEPTIVPVEYSGKEWFDAAGLAAYLAQNKHYAASPKWTRVSGETIETLTLTASIAFPCCHYTITNGEATGS